jgi:hypothetical protein
MNGAIFIFVNELMSKEKIKYILGLFYGQRIQLCGGNRKLINWRAIAAAVNRKFKPKRSIESGQIFLVTERWRMTAYNGLMRKT